MYFYFMFLIFNLTLSYVSHCCARSFHQFCTSSMKKRKEWLIRLLCTGATWRAMETLIITLVQISATGLLLSLQGDIGRAWMFQLPLEHNLKRPSVTFGKIVTQNIILTNYVAIHNNLKYLWVNIRIQLDTIGQTHSSVVLTYTFRPNQSNLILCLIFGNLLESAKPTGIEQRKKKEKEKRLLLKCRKNHFWSLEEYAHMI